MVFDDLDRALVHALQIDGRAPFRRIGEVLGVSDQTVARRYTRLRSAGAVRVLGLVDPVVVGDVQWMLRVRCAPDAAPEIADALARRADTSWIGITAGGTEITCGTRASPAADADGLVLTQLPRTPRVRDVSAQQVLHVFFGGAHGVVAKDGSLDDDQAARLAEGVPAASGSGSASGPGSGPVDDVDRRLLDVLRADGRTPVEVLARAAGTSPSTVRRRLHELRAGGALFFDVDFDHDILDMRLRTILWLAVAPDALEETGRALAGHPEVPFVAATTGRSNVYASVATPDAAALYRYLTTRVAALPGVREVETAPVMRTVKAAGVHYGARP